MLSDSLNAYLAPMRRKRLELAQDPDLVSKVLKRGNQYAREIAIQTLGEVREVMGMVYGS